jgi:hypothetical protein
VAGIFISYARDDDVLPPGTPDGKGFVTFLDEAIRYEFRNLGPEQPTIWRDTKRISDAAQFTPEIEEALKNTSFLLVILSPNWMARPWCKRELDTFAKYHGPDGLRERIFVVSKRHVEHDKRPSLLQGQVGFEFYVRNENSEEIVGDLEFFSRGQVQDNRYWGKVAALAGSLLRRKPSLQQPLYPATGRTIFVAKPASDMRAGYDRVVNELVGKGHTVVPAPAEDISLDSSATDVIDAALKNAEISVHLLGEKAGAAPEDQLPIVKLQLARAAAKAAADGGAKFHRIIWAPSLWTVQPGANLPESETTRHPIDVLAKFDRQLPTDKVEGDSLSKCVDFLNQHLITIFVSDPVFGKSLPPSDIAGDVRLYLDHSEQDSEYALSLAEALQQHKLETLLPAFEGPETETRIFNDKQLAECDAVVLCWASASEVWVRAQASGYRNWPALGRKQQFAYRAVVAAPPPGTRKKKGKVLFPRSDIDLVVDLSDKDSPTADILNALVPNTRATAP